MIGFHETAAFASVVFLLLTVFADTRSASKYLLVQLDTIGRQYGADRKVIEPEINELSDRSASSSEESGSEAPPGNEFFNYQEK